jgi:DNA-directed RNA polymerase subunit RPC12/RpoP
MLVERNGRELYICHNCFLRGDRRIEDGHGYRCPECRYWNLAGKNELCERCKNETGTHPAAD